MRIAVSSDERTGVATALVDALRNTRNGRPAIRSWDEYLARRPRPLE